MERLNKRHSLLRKFIYSLLLFVPITVSCISGNYSASLDHQLSDLIKQKRYAEAGETAKKSLELAVDQFGQNHPNVARALNNLAAVYHMQKHSAEAQQLYVAALIILENSPEKIYN